MSKQRSFVRNAADPKQVKAAGKKENNTELRNIADLKYILSDKKGRRFLWNLIGFTGFHTISYTGNSETFFNEGARNVGNKILIDIQNADPQSYLTMVKESIEGEYNEQ